MKRSSTMAWVYGISFALHATLGSAVASIEPVKEPEPIKVRVIEPPEPKADQPPEVEPPPPEPPPPVAEAPKPKPAKAQTPKPEAVAPAPVAPVPTFGVAMSGGVGMGGTAVPMGNAHAPTQQPTKRVAESRSLTATPAAQAPEADGCAEPAGKPKPLSMPRPEYTAEARAAAIEGKVRLEITVDENGVVTNVRVIESLDPGLDEAAVTALRGATFEAATRCGTAVSSTFNLAIKFAL